METTDSTMSPSKATSLKPTGEKFAWAPDMTPEMQVVIEKLMSYKDPALVTLSAQDARKQHSPTDAVMDVIKEHNISVSAPNNDTSSQTIPVNGGNIHLRIYTPKNAKSNLPVILYIHGGGWVIANLDTYDASASGISDQTGAVVVSVAYRQAPENKYPTAHNDCFAAYEWLLKNAASIKGDSKKIALAGESAGGNLACNVSMMARDKKIQMPLHQLLVYPIAGYNFTTESYQKSDSFKPLNRGLMQWFFQKYLNAPAEGKSQMIDLVNANLKGLPATTVICAEIDPLMSEGQTLSDKLKAAGVKVDYKLYKGVTHEFFGMAAVIPEAKQAQAFASDNLKSALK
ncbi:MAG: alpha/beta hydrolase [Ginsengibacter sp.]